LWKQTSNNEEVEDELNHYFCIGKAMISVNRLGRVEKIKDNYQFQFQFQFQMVDLVD